MKIKEVPKAERPREKFAKRGAVGLTDHELMAILIRTGIKGKNVVVLAKQILKIIQQIGVDKITLADLLQIKGLGQIKAGQILASLELGRRLLQNKKTELVLSARDVWDKMEDLRDSKKEHFVVFFLDTQHQIIKREIISIGTLNESLIHPREVFEPAVRYLTAQIIVAHNHPSGNLTPSPEDIAVTKRLAEAGDLLGIELLDHVIVTSEGFGSVK
ncbi:MAG: DNA repair protein RadC [Patescibacteria group bacterium]